MPPPRPFRSLAIAPNARHTTSPPPPPSPTFSDATNASAMNFGDNRPEKIITRANLKASLQAYEDLMTTSAAYRAALLTMSRATADFAVAISACSGMKGPSYEAGTRLQAASGLHHLIGNHWHLLAETLDRKFEKPLSQHLDTYRTIVKERSTSYEKALHEKSQIIRETEMGNMNRKERNLQSFREALVVLQRQVDDLDDLKTQHYQEIMEHEEEVWNVVQGKVCLMVRSTMDVFEKFTAKASDPVLEPMLQSIPDPFDSYGPPQAEDSIFSILPPLAVIASAPSPSPSPMSDTPESETATAVPSNMKAWVPTNGFFPNPPPERVDAPSPPPTPPHSVSPPPLSHRHSHPSSSNHQSRKSETKLRNVLPIIDEIRPRSDNDGRILDAETQSTLFPGLNGSSSHGIETNWESSIYGQSPYVDPTTDTTPRHSTLYSSTQDPSGATTPPRSILPAIQPSPPDTDVETNHSPRSDDTARVPIPT